MVLNTITNNMEKLIMKRKIIFHNETTIKNALLLFGQGWTAHRIALKMKVTDQTVYNWRDKYPRYAVKKVTNVTKAGTVTTIKPVKSTKKTVTNLSKNNQLIDATSELNNVISINFTNDAFKDLRTLALHECRTPEDQVRYLVIRELERVKRNTTNIPF